MKSQKNNSKNLQILTEEWLLRAQDDENSAEILLEEGGSPNTICFLSQQMAEKYLKAYLIFKGRRFPKIHDMTRLLRICRKVDEEFNTLKPEAQYLKGFYITTRYPGDWPQFTFREAKDAFNKALKIKNFVFKKIKI